VALSAAITVIIASTLGLPVSSTHIAVGAVFGVGFLREFIVNRGKNKLLRAAPENNVSSIDPITSQPVSKKYVKRKLVRRRHLMTIVAAWVITVPSAAILSGLIFFGLVTLF
jgi:PiT family inorganic phosphate transporter